MRLHQIGFDLVVSYLWQKAVADITVGAGLCATLHIQQVEWAGLQTGFPGEGEDALQLVEGEAKRAQIGPGVVLAAAVQFPLGPSAAIEVGMVTRVLMVRVDGANRFFPQPTGHLGVVWRL
jgi:hypothetical protein